MPALLLKNLKTYYDLMDKHAKEYKKLKEKYPDDILLYQVGIFYRIMLEDAGKAAQVTGLKLMMQGAVSEAYEVCGFPKSGLDKYVGKLIRAGFSVVVADQVKDEDGRIRREVVETIRVVASDEWRVARKLTTSHSPLTTN